MSCLRALLFGPLFLPRLWWWAYRRSTGQTAMRRWLLAEAGWAILVPVAGVLLLPWTPAVLVYAVLVLIGSWIYPLLTVYLPHHRYSSSGCTPAEPDSASPDRFMIPRTANSGGDA